MPQKQLCLEDGSQWVCHTQACQGLSVLHFHCPMWTICHQLEPRKSDKQLVILQKPGMFLFWLVSLVQIIMIISESDLCSCEVAVAPKNLRLQQDLNPWPPPYRCDALPTELWSLVGSRSRASSTIPVILREMVCISYKSYHIYELQVKNRSLSIVHIYDIRHMH